MNQLQSQITTLENKPNKTKEEQTELETKKKRLQELLAKMKGKSNLEVNKDKGDKTGFYVGLGVIGVVLIGLVLILVRRSKKRKKY